MRVGRAHRIIVIQILRAYSMNNRISNNQIISKSIWRYPNGISLVYATQRHHQIIITNQGK